VELFTEDEPGGIRAEFAFQDVVGEGPDLLRGRPQ